MNSTNRIADSKEQLRAPYEKLKRDRIKAISMLNKLTDSINGNSPLTLKPFNSDLESLSKKRWEDVSYQDIALLRMEGARLKGAIRKMQKLDKEINEQMKVMPNLLENLSGKVHPIDVTFLALYEDELGVITSILDKNKQIMEMGISMKIVVDEGVLSVSFLDKSHDAVITATKNCYSQIANIYQDNGDKAVVNGYQTSEKDRWRLDSMKPTATVPLAIKKAMKKLENAFLIKEEGAGKVLSQGGGLHYDGHFDKLLISNDNADELKRFFSDMTADLMRLGARSSHFNHSNRAKQQSDSIELSM